MVAWAPQPGAQWEFLALDHIPEVLLHGTRGGGKSVGLLGDFLGDVGQGYGAAWTGILFRTEATQLDDIIGHSHALFPRVFPRAAWRGDNRTWTFPGGEQLRFRHMRRVEDYQQKYHGHSYAWIGWEELTNWATDDCYRQMFSCLRSTQPKIRCRVRATTNPSGVGHGWVKARFRLSGVQQTVVGPLIADDRDPETGFLRPARIAVFSDVAENRVLLHAQPEYREQIMADATSAAQREAWGRGNWDIADGAMFNDVWYREIHCVPPIRPEKIPDGWRIDRSYDHGQSAPFSVGWWGESNGEPVTVTYRGRDGALKTRRIGEVRGDLVRLAEWYGWSGKPNIGIRMASREIGKGINERQERWGIHGRIVPGAADSSIFSEAEPGVSPAGEMAKEGVEWRAVDKSPGSRVQGWQRLRTLLQGSIPDAEGYREHPGLFVCVGGSGGWGNCEQFLRVFPVAPRDSKDPDDVDTNAEDHILDEVRYRAWKSKRVAKVRRQRMY